MRTFTFTYKKFFNTERNFFDRFYRYKIVCSIKPKYTSETSTSDEPILIYREVSIPYSILGHNTLTIKSGIIVDINQTTILPYHIIIKY